jgi:flagellar P-ring protein precursor FlgI
MAAGAAARPGDLRPRQWFSAGETVVAPRTNIEVEDQSNRRLALLQGGVTLQDLVAGLNALGVGPREIMTILQTIKAAGALQAELELR